MEQPLKTTDLSFARLAGMCSFVLFAGQFIVSRYGVTSGFSFWDVTAIRFSVAGVISIPFLVFWGFRDLGGIGWKRGMMLGLVGGAPYFLLTISSVAYAPATHIVVIGPGLTVLFGLAISAFWFKEQIPGQQLIASTVSVVGLLLISLNGLVETASGFWVGYVLVAMSAVSFAIYIACLGRWHLNALRAAMAVAFTSMAYLPFYFLFFQTPKAFSLTAGFALQAVYHGVIHGLLAITLLAYASRELGAREVSIMAPIAPATGLMMAMVFLGEQMLVAQWIGAGLICIGMILLAPPRKPG